MRLKKTMYRTLYDKYKNSYLNKVMIDQFQHISTDKREISISLLKIF